MEGSSQRDFKSSYKDTPPPSEHGSESDSSGTESPPATVRMNHHHHHPRPENFKLQSSSVIQKSLGLSAQPPDEGRATTSGSSSSLKDKAEGCNDIDDKEDKCCQSELCRALITSHDDVEDDGYNDTGLSLSHPGRVGNSGKLDTLVCAPLASLVEEDHSFSSEYNTASFVTPLFRDEAVSPQSNGISECAPALFGAVSSPAGNYTPKPCIRPVLSTDARTVQNNLRYPPKTTTPQERGSLLQSHPPRELTLQPPSLSKLIYTSPSSRDQCLDYNKISYTPPPSYQESLSYPVIQQQPLPTYASTMDSAGPCPRLTTSKEPVVSIIRFSTPPMTQSVPVSNPVARDNVFVWHSPSDEMCSRDSQAQDQYSDHQILALLACIMFWPIGLLAIYYANMANILRSEGVHAKSLIYSKRALLLSLISFMIGTGVYLTFYLQRQITL